MELQLSELFANAPYMVSFLAGVLTFFSPCVLPLIPAYLSYISGISVKQLNRDGQMGFKAHLHVLEASLLFVSGFSLVFILVGAAMAELIGDIFAYEWVTWIAGGIIIVFGFHFMGAVNIKMLNYESRADFTHLEEGKKGALKRVLHALFPFFLGLSFALGWTPCIGPIFASIVSLAADEDTKGIVLMALYAAGLGLPFVLSALLTGRALRFLNRAKRHFRAIEIIAGWLLVLIGLSIVSGGMGKITQILTDLP